MRLLFLLFVPISMIGQTRITKDSIIVTLRYKIEKHVILNKDTIYYLGGFKRVRTHKDSVYIYGNMQYLKHKR